VSPNPYLSFVPASSAQWKSSRGGEVRFFGLDVHRDFCEVAVAEDGELRSLGRVLSTPSALAEFAATLRDSDQVAMEATGVAAAIARILERHLARVVICKAQDLPVAQARARPIGWTPSSWPGCWRRAI
jgi:hypothetical protein